ncbi:sensor histidine kinase [Lacrimispora sp.]|uniref:sensor histidine kinase n=1 Tax=Lacrimispora sp. TaxID=2719234 RepID=UPI002FDB59F8
MKRWLKKLNLYQKFTITIIIIGLIPMTILSTFIANKMIRDYRSALSSQYEQAALYLSGSLKSMLDTYNTISKMPYYYRNSIIGNDVYSYMSFDNFRQIVYGSNYPAEVMEQERKRDMEEYLRYMNSVDNGIVGVHFLGVDQNGKELDFHSSTLSTYFKDSAMFAQMVGYEGLDRTINKMMVIPPHETKYFSGIVEPAFTVARNYFDLRGNVGNTPYVGTLYLDINVNKVNQLLDSVRLSGDEVFYIMNAQNICFYSSQKDMIGKEIHFSEENSGEGERELLIRTRPDEHGLSLIVSVDTLRAFRDIRKMQTMMYFLLGASFLALLSSSLFFSKQLTKPIRQMMKQMEQIEHGQFDISLSANSEDEIGILSQRFNQMSQELKNYINRYYVVQIKQKEAELTALKSQIYPHFLYNTLEVIRMTALEDGQKVPAMIEALSEQIRYLIGPMKDLVPLEKEVEMVKKYVYLLNCRINGEIQLAADISGMASVMVPKLILQPIVENAYIHGIKPKGGNGRILIEARRSETSRDCIEVTIMDNGSGMDEETLGSLNTLLAGSDPGIKNDYHWQSIGLKNVHDRIRFLYGEEFGIQVTSTEGIGTMVRILMKAEQGGERP